jgi:hypothetical protein
LSKNLPRNHMCDGIGTWYGRSLKQDWTVFIFVNWKFKIIIILNSLVKRLSYDVHLEDEISVELLNSVSLISFESIDQRHVLCNLVYMLKITMSNSNEIHNSVSLSPHLYRNELTGKSLYNSLNWKFCSFVSLVIQNDNE